MTRIAFAILCFTLLPAGASVSMARAQQSAPQASPSSTARVPEPQRITAYTLSPELHRKAHTLNRIRFAEALFSIFYGLLVLWFILERQWAASFRDCAERVSGNRIVQAMIFGPCLIAAIVLFLFPLELFHEWLSKDYGISVQSWGSWLGDWAKLQGLTVLSGSLLALMFYAIFRRSPRRWWFYFWVLCLPIFLFVLFVSPYVFDPLFNQYEPLASKAPALVPRLQEIARRGGLEIPAERMFWMKASDKTIATNASVNGVGASQRVVIWDTTLAQETPDEVLMDFGHELGHYALGHVWKEFVFSTLLILGLMYLLYRSIGWMLNRWGRRWRIRSLDDWASLPAILLLLGIFGFFAMVAANTVSRYAENQADVYGLEVTHGLVPDGGQAAAHGFQKFGETVFVDPDPNPLNVFLFYNHPTVSDRIHLFVIYDPWSDGRETQFVK